MSGEPESQRYILNQISMLLDGVKGLNTKIARQVDAIGRYDVEFIKLGRFMNKFEGELIELRADMGKVKLEVGQLRIEIGEARTDVGQLRTEMGQFRSEVGQFRSEMEARLDAILKRIDDLEGRTHDIADHVQELRLDGVRQYNEVINALQDSYQNRMSLKDLDARVSELERIVGLRPPPAA